MSSFHSGNQTKKTETDSLVERVISVDRVSRVVAGGRRMRFRVMMLVGDQAGHIGIGIGKSHEYQDAHRKAAQAGRRNLFAIFHGVTLPKAVSAKYSSSHVLLKPAPAGASIIAGGVVRAVCELAGIENVVAKQMGNNNRVNVLGATVAALQQIQL